MQRTLLAITTVLFALLTGLTLWHHGYTGVLAHQFQNVAGIQVFTDLSIALGLISVWMWRDAKATGRTVWPWLLITLVLGCFGPLLYLLMRPPSATSTET